MKPLLFCLCLIIAYWTRAPRPLKVLVFTKTAGYHHSSIDTGVAAIRALGAANGFAVEQTSNIKVFTDSGLRQYAAVIFLSTTGNILNAAQEVAFERYIQAGGGFVGVHAAARQIFTSRVLPSVGTLAKKFCLRLLPLVQKEVWLLRDGA